MGVGRIENYIKAWAEATGRPVSFEYFMQAALYQKGIGYYAKEKPVSIGREGDFYTSVSVGPLFGRLLARQFLEMWELLGKPDPFWIIEQGAHDGQLARDILDWCRAETPGFARSLRYGIVKGPAIDGTTAFADLRVLAAEKPVGVFFSNELVDSFPVRLVTCRDGQCLERCVAVEDEKMVWVDCSIEDIELSHTLAALRLPLIEGYTTEINLKARRWIRSVARAMQRGYVITIDYGFPAAEYYAAHRTAGTLTAYAKHRRVDDVLAHPGEQDITAHVDFTALMEADRRKRLRPIGFLDQQRFLTGIAHDELAGAPGPKTGIAQNLRAWNTLTHPQYLGAKFHALVQAMGVPAELSCLRFARASDL